MPALAYASSDSFTCTEGAAPDCLGDCGGSAVLDICGVCAGDGTSCLDCKGVPFGPAIIDDCGVCDGNNESKSCDGYCGGRNFVQCNLCTTPDTGCKTCKALVPPQDRPNGIAYGCVPAGCGSYTFLNSPSWRLYAAGCGGGSYKYHLHQNGAHQNKKGLFCGCLRISGMGCFTPEAKILTVSGERRIDSLQIGDMVKNPITGKEIRIAKIIQSPEEHPLVQFGYENVSVTVTQTHPVYTASGLKKASELQEGDRVRGSDGRYHAIMAPEFIEPRYGQQVYNIILETELSKERTEMTPVSLQGESTTASIEDNLVLSDGIVTGDMVLQAMLNQTE